MFEWWAEKGVRLQSEAAVDFYVWQTICFLFCFLHLFYFILIYLFLFTFKNFG